MDKENKFVYCTSCLVLIITAIPHSDWDNFLLVVSKTIPYLNELLGSNLFNVISIVVSGLISWLISKFYYDRGNRESLKMAVIFPIKMILKRPYNSANYDKLCELLHSYYLKFLSREEYAVLEKLVMDYEKVKNYNENRIYAETLVAYFGWYAKEKNIDTEIIAQKDDTGYTIGWITPIENGDYNLCSRLEQVLNNYDVRIETETCQEAIIYEFNCYCSRFYTRERQEYFSDYSLLEVLTRQSDLQYQNDDFKEMEKSKKAFLNLTLANDEVF